MGRAAGTPVDVTERQTDITEEEPDLQPPADDELRGGTTEIPDEPMGVPADGDSSVGDQPGIPEEGEPPASE
jgi:hypothetical protein